MRVLRRIWPVLVLLLAAAVVYALGLQHAVSFQALGARQHQLAAWVGAHPVAAPLIYVAIYAVAVALSVPGGAVLTVAGGVLFGTLGGAAAAVAGATAGATLLFLAARHALRGLFAGRVGALLDRIRPGLERDGFSYLLALRLLPVFPFWLVNLAPALAGMRLAPYVAATAIGIVPATLVFASIGAGLGGVLAEGRQPDLSVIVSPRILLPLAGLAALSLLPVVWRRWRERAHA